MIAGGSTIVGVLPSTSAGADRSRRVLPRVAVVSRDALPAADAIIVAVPDHALAAVAAEIAPHVSGRGTALHTSGATPAAVLAPLAARGWSVGSIHPLTSFPDAAGAAVPLEGVLAVVEGDPEARVVAAGLARQLGMRPRSIAPEDKPLYHAAAVLAANLTHILVVAGLDALVAAGFERGEAATALRPLVEAAVDAALSARGVEKLTGPLARGDADIVRAHLAALPPEVGEAYAGVAGLGLSRLLENAASRRDVDRFHEVAEALTGHGRRASFPLDGAQ